jgi:hypothetical protein
MPAKPDAALIRTCNTVLAARAACHDITKGRGLDRLPPRDGKRVEAILATVREGIVAARGMGSATFAGCKAKASVLALIYDEGLATSLVKDVLRVA